MLLRVYVTRMPGNSSIDVLGQWKYPFSSDSYDLPYLRYIWKRYKSEIMIIYANWIGSYFWIVMFRGYFVLFMILI